MLILIEFILRYGQTGTGKTYTMGILDTVADESAGDYLLFIYYFIIIIE